MTRTHAAFAVAATLVFQAVVASPVSAQSWELVPPYGYTNHYSDHIGLATASSDGTLTVSATAGGSYFYSSAGAWAGGAVTWTSGSTSDAMDTTAPAPSNTKTLTIIATLEVVSVALIGNGARAKVWVTGCREQSLGMEDTGKVLTFSCTMPDVKSGIHVAGGAAVFASDSSLGSSVQASYMTGSLEVRVRKIAISG